MNSTEDFDLDVSFANRGTVIGELLDSTSDGRTACTAP